MDTENGILGKIPGAVIGGAAQTLPKAGPAQVAEQEVIADAWHAGVVRIKYRLHRHAHRKNVLWWWSAYYAEAVGPDDPGRSSAVRIDHGDPRPPGQFGHLMPQVPRGLHEPPGDQNKPAGSADLSQE